MQKLQVFAELSLHALSSCIRRECYINLLEAHPPKEQIYLHGDGRLRKRKLLFCAGAAPKQVAEASAQHAAALAQPPLKQLPSLNRLEDFLFGQPAPAKKLPLSADLLNELRHDLRPMNTLTVQI